MTFVTGKSADWRCVSAINFVAKRSHPTTATQQHPVDAVVIGRNEGERLRACLASLQMQVGRVIYVDSGSTDGSADMARDMGAEVIRLDMAQPFTAARARNP